MYERFVKSISFLIGGIFIFFVGILFIIENVHLYENLISIVSILLFIVGFLSILKYLVRKKDVNITKALISIIIAFIMNIIPSIPLSILPITLSLYLLCNSAICFLYYYLLKEINESGRVIEIIKGIFYFVVSIPLLFYPIINLKIVLIILGIYFILIGIYFIKDFLDMIISTKNKEKLKRKIHLSLPIFITALIPYSTFKEINEYINSNKVVKKKIKENSDNYDLEIFVHVSGSGFGSVGHIDLYYNGKVISYGNYDMKSRKLGEAIGDGVLFTCNSKEKYLQFCKEHSNKLLFGFGIKLNEKQKIRIDKKIREIEDNLEEWIPYYKRALNNNEKIYENDYKDYASSLYKITNAKFYKFKKGKFKKFFILKTNCAMLVDTILGEAGTDILRMSGIIAPGSYYDYLYREFCKKKSIVVSYNIYIGKEILIKKH